MKRQYKVAESVEVQREDDSFKLCFCTMLVFLTLMVLTCVCFWPRNMVQKKVSYSNPVQDSWSGHLGYKDKTTTSSTVKPKTSADTGGTSPGTSNPKRTVATMDKLTTDKTSGVEFTSTSEVPVTSNTINEVSPTVLLKREFAHGVEKNVQTVTESDEVTLSVTEITDGKETVQALKSSETTLNNPLVNPTGSSTLLGNTNVDLLPDSLENTIPYSSSSSIMNELSSTVDYLKSKTYEDSSTSKIDNEVSTGKTMLMSTEVIGGYSAITEEISEPTKSVSALTTNTNDKPTVEEDLTIVITVTSSTEETSSDYLGSDLVIDNSIAHLSSSPSTNDIPNTNYEYSSLSHKDDSNAENSSTNPTDLTDIFEDFASDNFNISESSCLKCPEPVCPVCLVEACSTTEIASPLDNTCKTSQCHKVASRLLSLMDTSVDPCENFYSYACGGILDNPVLLEDEPALNVWNRIEKAVQNISSASPLSHQQLKSYYDGCVDYDRLVTLQERRAQGWEILESVGKFYDNSTTPEEGLTELLIRLLKHGSGTLFSIGLDVDSTNASQFQVVVSLPNRLSSHFLSPEERRSRCSRHKANDDIPLNLTEAYEAHRNCMNNFSEILDTTRTALEFFQLFDNNYSQLVEETLTAVELDLFELLEGLPAPKLVQKDIQSKNYELLSKVQLKSEMPQIDWGYLISTLFNFDFDDTIRVQVYFMGYLKDLFAQLQSKSSRSIHNSLLAVFAHSLYSDIVQTHSLFNRERYCLRVTASLLPTITSNLYLATFPPNIDQALRQQVMLIYQQLVSVMESRLSAAKWLDERSSNELIKKLRFMSIQLPEMFSDSQLADSLGQCDLYNKQFFEDSVCLLQQLQTCIFALYSMDPYNTEAMWPHFLTSFSTNPLFVYGLNKFLIPYAAVVPAIDKELPKHVVLAQLGNILARGIAHNFDSTGIKFAASGNMEKILSEAMYYTYETVVNSSNQQFSWSRGVSESARIYTYLLDPELTLNERLSDITAANLSLSLFSESEVGDTHLPWLPISPKQVYFITLAQTFCSKMNVPEVFTSLFERTGLLPFDRVFNLAANSEQFAVVFRCPHGTNMNVHSALKTRPFPLFVKEESDIS